jgi:hypothetical protein
MCIGNRQLDPKARRMRAIGCISLALALVLRQFIEPAGQIEQNWVHAASGFFLGLSIVAIFAGLIRCRRAKQD